MLSCHRLNQKNPDPLTQDYHYWIIKTGSQEFRWQGYTGPLRLDENEFSQLCQELLEVKTEQLPSLALKGLQPSHSAQKRLILHSTTPGIKAFETDLAMMAEGRQPLDITTYMETRSLYFAQVNDIAVGRTIPWRSAASQKSLETLILGNTDYYYLSHALLKEATTNPHNPRLLRIIDVLRKEPETVVSLYSLEPEMQLFLLWLGRQAGVEVIKVDTNTPQLVSTWNRKSMLHPTVQDALSLNTLCEGKSVREVLMLESQKSESSHTLGFVLPVIPGYTLPSKTEKTDFVTQVLAAADLLNRRHGIKQGCLKPSQGGDGGRIIPDIDLTKTAQLEQLAHIAWELGGDYLLEAHVTYSFVEIGRERIFTTPSTHVRNGKIADGLTMQFNRGSSWKGNIYINEQNCGAFGIDHHSYKTITITMKQFIEPLTSWGIIRAGVDFALGTIGGLWGEQKLIAVQDINMKLTGAEFLRVFLDRQQSLGKAPWVVSRVFVPTLSTSASLLKQKIMELCPTQTVELVAAVPGRWGMFVVAGESAVTVAQQALSLERQLITENLAEEILTK